MPVSRKSRARRVLGVIGAVVGTTVTFVTATAVAAVVHLDAPVTRRLVATEGTKILRGQFAGDIAIERVGSLGLHGLDGVRVRIKDPTGMQVLFVDGASVRVRGLAIARSALFGKGDIVIGVDAASIQQVDAAIDGDAAGNLRIANAFAEKNPTPPKPADPNARGVRVEAPEIKLTHAWVHGQAPGAPPVDADISALVGHVHVDPKIIKADLDSVQLVTRGLPRGVDPKGRIGGHFSMPSATGKDMGVDATFDGAIAGIPTVANATMDGQKIDARVDGHDVSGRGMRATFGELELQDEVVLHAEAHGELPHVAAKAHVSAGRSTVDLDGKVDLTDGTKAEATVGVRHVDAHKFLASAPASDVGLDTHVDAKIEKNGDIHGDYTVATVPGVIDGNTLPILKMHGDFTKDTATAIGNVSDPRVTADFDANMTTVDGQQIVEGRMGAKVADLSKLPKVGAQMKGHADVTAQGRANLGTKALSGSAHVVGGGFAYGAQTVDNATIVATAHGTTDQPVIDVGVHTGGLASGKNKIGTADIRGDVHIGAETVIDNAHVDMVKEGRNVTVSARRVQVGGPKLVVQGASIEGLGAPITADVTQDANEIHVKLDAQNVDLALVAALAGKPSAVRNGHLTMNGDVKLRRDGASGEMHAKLTDFSAQSIDGGKANLDASFKGRSVSLGMTAEMADAGTFELATKDLTLGGSPSDIESWKHAHGKAKFDVNVDAGKLATMVPKDQLPVSELHGQLVVAGIFRRDSGNVPPELSIHAHTRGLIVAGKAAVNTTIDPQHGPTISGVQPWRSDNVDGSVDASIDATSGLAEVAFHVYDKTGTLAALDAKSDLPYQKILAEPARAMELVQNAPLSGRFVIPKRKIADMPQIVGTKSLPGTIEAELTLLGTVMDPRAELVAHARGIRSPQLPVSMATDADVKLDYDGKKADLTAAVSAEKHQALTMSAHVDLVARDLIAPKNDEPLAWGGSAKVKLASFPIETINAIADRKIHGHVSGEASIDDLHDDAKLHANIGIENLRIGRAKYTKGIVTVDTKDNKLAAHARLEQTDGYADVTASTGIMWGAELAPALDPNGNLEAHLDAKAFRAAAALPFVQTIFNELDGRIDATANVKLGPGLTAPTMDGKIDYHDGTLQLASVGDEFKNAHAVVTFMPGGLIKVDNVSMQSAEGDVTADAQIRTRGLGLGSASANLHIPKRRPIDFAMQGQPFGAISGDVKVAATNSEDGKTLSMKVDVPTMNVALPQKLKSGVQQLSDEQKVRVGVYRDASTFVKLPLDKDDLDPPKVATGPGNVMVIDVNLGDITIVQGNQARVVVGGAPHIRVADTTQVTGQIQVKSGKIDVQGKEFKIEKGTVTFQPDDVSNPIIVASAGWTADDGSKIEAEFVGPVKTGKVNLTSDPPRPKNEVLAMVLFGTADGANATPQGGAQAPDGTTKAATSLGGGYAAQGLTEAMDDLTGVQATARIDTSRSSNPAPEIEVQLARRVSLAFEHVLGTPPISEPDTNLAIIDFRFRKNWSLETTFGDRGKVAADAVWKKRY